MDFRRSSQSTLWVRAGDAFLREFPPSGGGSGESGAAAMMHDKVHEKHEDQDAAEGDHNGSAGGCVE